MHLAGLERHGHIVVGHQAAEALGHMLGRQQHLARSGQRALRQRRRVRQLQIGHGPAHPACRERLQRGPQAFCKALQHQHHQQAEDDDLEVAAGAQQGRQYVLQLLLDQGDQRGAQHRAPQVAGAADHGHEQVLDAHVQVEGRRAHEALHVGVEPARQRGQQGCQHEELDAVVRRVDAHGLGHDAAAAQRADGPALARVQQVVQQPQRHQQHGPDHHAHGARRGQRDAADHQRRNARDAGLPAQELHVAEQVVQAQPPGDGAQRQVVALQLDRDRAQQPGHDEGDEQAQRQAHPGQARRAHQPAQRGHRGRCRADPGRGIGADAHEGRLAERGHAAHAGQHHQACGHHGEQADVAEDDDGEIGQEAPGRGQQRNGRHREHARADAARSGLGRRRGLRGNGGAHSSSSTWWLLRDRHHSTGMISVNTSTSL